MKREHLAVAAAVLLLAGLAAVLPAAALDDPGRIAFQSFEDGNANIYAMNPDGSALVRLTDDSSQDNSPAWSPDGSRIAFASERDGNGEIYVMNADGSGQTRLTTSAANEGWPSWSPDGTRIAYAVRVADGSDLWVMDADGENPVRLTDAAGYEFDPAWSPDGTEIAYVASGAGVSPGVRALTLDGSGDRTIVTLAYGSISSLEWSPDGSRIAYSIQGGGGGTYIVNPDGTGLQRQPGTTANDIFPAWSPDGSRIAFANAFGQICIVDAADGLNPTTFDGTSASDLYLSWGRTYVPPPPDTTPPTVVSSSPAPGAVKVAIETDRIEIEFSEPIQYVPAGWKHVTLKAYDGGAYSDCPTGDVTVSGSTLVIPAPASPSPWFANWEYYYVDVNGVQDLAGNEMSVDGNPYYQFHFQTVSTDTTPPAVVSTDPADEATGVAADARITASMSETINRCVGTAAMVDSAGAAVPLDPLQPWTSDDYQTIEIHPAAPLSPGTRYTVTLSGLIDGYLNEMAAPYSWSFTTAAANEPPVASFTAVPAKGLPPLAVAFDASGSSDPDGTIASYRWDFGDGTTGSGIAPSHTYTAAMTCTATLTVTDSDGATATATATILAETPVQATSDLRTKVTALGLPAKIQKGMTDKLDAAIAAMSKNSKKTAGNNLNAFISLVKAQKGKTLTAEQADALIAEATRIIAAV